MTRSRTLWLALTVAAGVGAAIGGCQRTNGGHVVVAVGMSIDEIDRASTDLGRWLRESHDVITEDGFRVWGEADGVRLRHPATGHDIELGASTVSMYIGGEGLKHASINPQHVERCGADYAETVARLLAGGFVTADGRPFDAHLEETYAHWRAHWAEERARKDRALGVQLLRDDARLDVWFLVDPSGEPPTKSARDACFVGVELRRR